MKPFLPPLLRKFRPLAPLPAAVVATLLAPSGWAANPVETAQNLAKTARLCTEQTARLERQESIPEHLLTAISLTETGRWQKGEREILAWPWTVTAHGRGQHFDSKQEALLEVEVLLTQGVRNIDVGCMQVNLKYHDGAFASLSEALEPAANTAYAATFLKKLYTREQDWMRAVGAYHSSTPDKNRKYRAKLVRLWNKARGSEMPQPAATESARLGTGMRLPKTAARDIDHQRIRDLNKMFRQRRAGDPVAQAEGDRFMQQAMQRHEELNAWREAQVKGIDSRHWAIMRRAERQLRDRQALAARDKPSFDERRRRQLGAWRDSQLWIPPN